MEAESAARQGVAASAERGARRARPRCRRSRSARRSRIDTRQTEPAARRGYRWRDRSAASNRIESFCVPPALRRDADVSRAVHAVTMPGAVERGELSAVCRCGDARAGPPNPLVRSRHDHLTLSSKRSLRCPRGRGCRRWSRTPGKALVYASVGGAARRMGAQHCVALVVGRSDRDVWPLRSSPSEKVRLPGREATAAAQRCSLSGISATGTAAGAATS